MYQLFKENSELTVGQLRKAIPMDWYHDMLEGGDDYIVLSNVAPIQGKFTLFAPIHETDQVVVEY